MASCLSDSSVAEVHSATGLEQTNSEQPEATRPVEMMQMAAAIRIPVAAIHPAVARAVEIKGATAAQLITPDKDGCISLPQVFAWVTQTTVERLIAGEPAVRQQRLRRSLDHARTEASNALRALHRVCGAVNGVRREVLGD